MSEQHKDSLVPDEEQDPMLAELLQIVHESGLEEESVTPELISKVLTNSSQTSARRLLRTLNKSRREMLVEHQNFRSGFEKRLYRLWGTALGKLEMMIVCCSEAGEEYNTRNRPGAIREQDLVFDVLTRLHSRAVQTSREILTLLRAGFPAGAHARWRTLHEIAVVGAFIARGDNKLAKRYLLHADIESHKAMKQYEQHYAALGLRTPIPSDMRKVERRKEALLKKYGKDFYNDYGWASGALGKSRPTFAELEAAAGLTHFRPWYRMSSHPVHAGSKGLLFNLGVVGSDTVLAGASNGGLADPGHATAISLGQITVSLLLRDPWVQDLIMMRAMLLLVDEIGTAFLSAHRRWEVKAGVSEER